MYEAQQQKLPRNASIAILEEPMSRVRFRYATEGEKAGNIYGSSSNNLHQTFPTVVLNNCEGYRVEVIMSCVTDTPPAYYPHPHRLVGQDCMSGVSRIVIEKVQHPQTAIQFSRVGVQCCRHRDEDIIKSLQERYPYACNPFNLSSPHTGNYDLSKICLCFQAIISTESGPYYLVCVSRPIVDRIVAGDLMISRLSRTHGSVRGGDELFLLCSCIKKDVEVVFELPNGSWSAKAEFTSSDIHKQIAVVLRTPPFQSQNIQEPVFVNVYLQSPLHNERSEPKTFCYVPENPDPFGIEAKRKRKADGMTDFFKDAKIPPFSQSSVFGRQPFAAADLPNLLKPTAASVGPTFPPLSASFSAASSLSHTLPVDFAAGPHAEWRFDYPTQQFQRPHPVIPRVHFERPQQVLPPAVPQPSLSFTVPEMTMPSSVVNSSQMASDSSVVHSAQSVIPPQPSSDGTTTCLSLDDEIVSWLVDVANNPNSLNADVDLNGILSNIVDESLARTDSAAADVASSSTSHPQVEITIPELQDVTDYDNLLNQIEQLNKFGKPT